MKDKCKEFSNRFEALQEEADNFYRGKKVKIISSYYNGQPFGDSRKALTGKIVKIINVCLEDGLSFGCEGLRPYIRSDEIEFI